MNEEFEKVKKWFTTLSLRNVSYDRQGIRPGHDWIMILVTAIVVAGFLAGGAFYFYTQIEHGNLYPVVEDNTTKEVVINSTLLKKIVEKMDVKESTAASLKTNKPVSSDPSL